MPSPAGWDLVFAEDFNAQPASGWAYESAPAGLANISFVNSCLRITTTATGANPQWDWAAAYTTTRFTYGYFEARVKIPPAGKGLIPGVWINSYPDAHQEIDLFETIGSEVGASSVVHLNYHTWRDGSHVSSQHSYTYPGNFSDGWHIVAAEWRPDAIYWYLDDVLRATQSTNLMSKPARFQVNHKDDKQGQWDGPPDGGTPYPNWFDVDWMRVYQPHLWRGYVRLTYGGALDATQQTQFAAAIANVCNTQNWMPHTKTHYRTLGAQDFLAEVATLQEWTKAEWVDALYDDINTMTSATMDANLTVTTYAGANWEARRLACKAALSL